MESKQISEALIDIIAKEPKITGRRLAGMLKTNEQEIRAIINDLRSKGMPIISEGKGYFISYNEKHILNQIISLQGRATKIFDAVLGLEKTLSIIQMRQPDET